MGISAKEVKALRERTGAGMMDCKRALADNDGDMEAAIKFLEMKGIAAAKKKSSRVAAEGLVRIWANEDATEAVLVEVNSETDFVSRNEQFQEFADKVAAAIGASDITSNEEIGSVAVGDQTIESFTTDTIAALGENISVRRFVRVTSPEGLVGTYIHAGDQLGVLVETKVNGGADRGAVEDFARDVAMHIAAMNPPYLNASDIPAAEREEQEAIFAAQLAEEGKPENIIPKIITGKIKKWESEISLLEQAFVKDTDKTIAEFQKGVDGAELVGFVRFQVGEGIDKGEVDFAAEVAEQLKG
ncbi:translation elongation factor Ts [Bradymonas sediminis]|uniref:Elongation factor Ts n=1 Tax=Bradymonas sediminis TaxID=1548548 RepID=A0A2Z4FJU5_9DELT|nr:translation elongation factor Ts [Bradymonas sediminis]AWV89105.1 elongation factor Ts [Bradymonas sediminis]TDP64429.1 translation elongation factor Ts (EF-Ts) [Bradymonas sediminis]